jgi:hypothetical protein
MAVVDEIAVKLGIQTGDLKAALSDANASIKTFGKQGSESADGFAGSIKGLHKGMRELKELFVAGGAIEAVKSFFELAIKSAEDNTDATNENAAAVRRFGDSLKSLHGDVGSIAMNIVGTFNRVGETIGDATKHAIDFWQAQITGNKANLEAENQAAESEKAAEDQERAFAIEKNKYGQELTQLTQQINAERQKEIDLLEKAKPLNVQLDDIQSDIAKQTSIMNDANATIVDRRKAELQILKDQSREAEIQAELEKQRHEDTLQRFKDQLDAQLKGLTNEQQIKLLTDDIASNEAIIAAQKKIGANTTDLEAQQKILVGKLTKDQGDEEAKRLETKKKIAGSDQEEVEFLTLQHKIALGIATGPEQLRYQQIKLMREEREKELEIIQLAAKAESGTLTPEETKRFNKLVDQKAVLDQQIADVGKLINGTAAATDATNTQTQAVKSLADAYNEVAEAAAKGWSSAGSGSPLGLHNLGSYSDDVLKAKLQQLQDQAAQGKMAWDQSGASATLSATGSTFENTNYYLYSQIGSIQDELKFRQTMQNAFARGGRSGALQAYLANGGDALSFDTAFANMNSWSSGNNQQANQLDSINGKLGAINGTLQSVFQTNTPQLTR